MEAKEKWNKKYEARLKNPAQPQASERLKSVERYFEGGKALDLACGLGGNSLYLASLGYRVEAVDISETAIAYLKEKAVELGVEVDASVRDLADLDSRSIRHGEFDLVLSTYYLDRNLFSMARQLVKEGGFMFIETYYSSPKVEEHKVSAEFRLEPKELLHVFSGWEIILFEQNEEEGIQTIFCRKP